LHPLLDSKREEADMPRQINLAVNDLDTQTR
jgi:hypothetical protein